MIHMEMMKEEDGTMAGEARGRKTSKKRLSPAVTVLALFLVLVLIGLVALRLLDWRGQRVEGQMTTLVNPWNSSEATGYRPQLTAVQGVQVDEACAQALQNMLADCAFEGNAPVLGAGYLSRTDLESNPAFTQEEDSAGYSEHELGLAVDILDEETGDPAASTTLQWLRENAWRYGFILRYPQGAEEQTGVAYCPWHYRYVGESAAAQIQQLNITLEEYAAMFYNDSAEVVFEK